MSGVAARSATVAVVPSDPSQTYYFSVVRSADLANDETLIAADLAAFGRDADDKGLSLGDYLERILSTGPDSFTFSNQMEPETDYIAYAYGLSVEGTATTAVSRQPFRTPSAQPQPSDCSFTITVTDIAASEAVVQVVPSDDETRYFYAVLEKETFDKAQSEEGGIFAADMVFFEYMAQMDNLTVEQTINQLTTKGGNTMRYVSLSPETDYYAYAYGLEPDGFVTTELYAEPFRTKAPERRECTFEITVEQITATGATVTVIPSDKELTYLGQYITDEQIAQGGGDLETYYANYFRAMADMAGVPVSEVVAQDVITDDLVGVRLTDLTEGETYNVFAVGVDAYGNFITDAQIVRFTTGDAPGPVTQAPFDLAVTLITDAAVQLRVSPADAAGRYLAGVLAEDEAATFGGVAAYLRAELDMYGAMGMIDTYLDSHAHTGSWSGVFDRLEPGSPYEAYAVGVDDSGAFTTPLTDRSFVAGVAGGTAVRMHHAALSPAMRQIADSRAGILN